MLKRSYTVKFFLHKDMFFFSCDFHDYASKAKITIRENKKKSGYPREKKNEDRNKHIP